MLLPTELETAMSPKPFLATRTEVMRSGMDVPAARNVNPMTSGGTSKVSPTKHETKDYMTSKDPVKKIETKRRRISL
jgi:hypothetical protein